MLIVAITGLAQSGKDTSAKYLSEKYGFAWFDFSRDALKDELKRRKQPATKDNMSALGDELRRKYGVDLLAQRLVEKIRKRGAQKIVISGVRSPEEALCLKKHAEKFFMIRLVVSPEIRIRRSRSTGIIARDERDIQNKGMQKVFDMADAAIENNGTKEELYKKIDALMQQF